MNTKQFKRNFQSVFGIIAGVSVLLMCISIVPAYSQAGSTGLSFLKFGLGSASVGMGETYVAGNSEPVALNYNPATLILSSGSKAMFSHRSWIQDTKSNFLGASSHIGDVAVGFGLHSVSVSDIELRTTPGEPEGMFDAKNVSIGVGAAFNVTDEVSAGLSVNYLFEKILIDEAGGYGINVGAIYRTPWDVRLGFAVDHLGSMNELNISSSSLPTTYRFGGAFEMPLSGMVANFKTAAEIVSVKGEGTAHLHIGAEFEYESMFAVRAGFLSGYESKNITTGLGFKYSLFRFDYAFVPVKLDLGSAHTFTVAAEF